MNGKRLIYAEDLLAQFPVGDGVTAAHARRAIEKAATVDAVEVVRCRDCKNAEPIPAKRRIDYFDPDKLRHCKLGRAEPDAYDICGVWEDGYCDDGKRKEEHNGTVD